MFGFEIDPKIIWMGLGILLIIIEMSSIPGIGFLFAGLGAITTFILLEFGFVDVDLVSNIAIFLLSSAIWTALLWIPLKRSLKNPASQYSDMIGENCKVSKTDLKKGHVGSILWSGTIMKASVDDTSSQSVIKAGSTVQIVAVKGNTAYVKSIK